MYKLEQSIQEKKVMLAEAVAQLKTEFIGIDGIIDEVSDAILPWWLFPQHQLRPLIINLWGMTGSGKTALINRLATLLECKNSLLRFDMGEFGASSGFLKYTLTRQLSQYNETAPIIVLDEFQFAKTKDESGKEVNNYNLRIIWDLLDSGVLNFDPDGLGYYASRAKKVLSILEALLKKNVKVERGILKSEVAEINDVFSNYVFGYEDGGIDRTDGKVPFAPEEILVSDKFCTGIYEMNSFLHDGWKDVANKIKQFNSLNEIFEFINNIYIAETSVKTMDLKASLVFVVGNLDEAFVMSSNINPDIDADEFQRYTQKITIADIKRALQHRFRNEQIARLGNTHLIYHAFSHENFQQLIQMHLDRVTHLVESNFKLKVTFSKSVNELIYAEGVFPTQGVRPVISTIRNLIEANIAKVILHHEESGKTANKVNWDFSNDRYRITFYKGAKQLSEIELPVLQKVNSLRLSTKNDLQAMVAVHEAGHAIVSMYEARIVPEYIITKTVDTESQGFTYILLPEDVVTYKLLIDQIKIGLGGYAAEAMIFGKDFNTTGVSEDLNRVTTIAQQIVRDYGMHGLPARHNLHQYGGHPYQFTFSPELEDRCRSIILYCLEQTINCLHANKAILLDISKYLADHSRIDKPEIINFATQNAAAQGTTISFLDKGTYYNFREKLFGQE